MLYEDTFTVADAYALAKTAHAGQVDKQDRDYFEAHLVPIAARLAVHGDYAQMGGILHDIIEDTREHPEPYTADRLLALAVPPVVVAAVVSVTREPDEPYMHMIKRACLDPLGVLIKLEDNHHNIASAPGLATTDPAKATSLLTQRYLPARDLLTTAATLHRIGMPEKILPVVFGG